MAKPTTSLHWADSPTTLRTEPAEGVKNAGFSVLTKLPAQYFNWISGICGDWITWLNLRLFDGYTVPTMGSDCRLTGDPDEGLSVENEAGTLLPVICAEPVDDEATMVATSGYIWKCLGSFISFEHDYTSSPLTVATATKTYLEFSAYTPTITGQGISVSNNTQLVFEELGVYHVAVAMRWAAGPASAYARSIIVDLGGVEHTAFMMNEVSGNVARTQMYALDVEVTDVGTDVLQIAAYQASGSNDYVNIAGVSVHQVSKRFT